jgi:hypothetical protein
MLVYIEGIQQNMSLQTGEVESFARLKLPTGEIISVPLDEEQIMKVMEASASGGEVQTPTEEAAEVIQNTVAQYQPAEELQEEPGEMVRWAELPDNVLSDDIKEVLAASGVEEEMPMDRLVALVDSVTERLAELQGQDNPPRAAAISPEQYAQWPAQQPVAQQPAVQPARRQQRQQPVGRVVVPQAPPVRTVPKDERGYPVVPGMAQSDPGEIPVHGDEDGVSSL